MRFVFDSAKSTHRQSKAVDDKPSGYWSPVFRNQHYEHNFIIRFPTYGVDAAAGQFATLILASFLENTVVSYDGHFLRLFISVYGTKWTRWLREHKRFNLHENPLQTTNIFRQHQRVRCRPLQIHPTFLTFQQNWWILVNDTCYFGKSFSDHIVQKTSSRNPKFSPFHHNVSINISFF